MFKESSIIQYLKEAKDKNVPPEEYYGVFKNILEQKARNTFTPLHGNFELVPFCNLNCKMCYIHVQENHNNIILTDISSLKLIMEQAHAAGMITASLTGGEALLHPFFDEIFLYLKSIGVRVSLLTNGLLMDDKRIEFLKEHRPKMIQVSLYGSSDDAYENVTGKRAFEIVKSNIIKAKNAGLPVSISITPNRYMVEDIDGIIECVESLKIPYNINSRLITPRKNTERQREDFTPEQYAKIYKASLSAKGEDVLLENIKDIPEESLYGEPAYGLKCGAGRSSFTIKCDGTMCPCSSLDDIISRPIDVGFDQAWHEINEAVEKYLVPCECENCAYNKVCLSCAAMHKDAPYGHCDKSICERTKYLVSRGIIKLT